ncbi:hypothetical protein PROFUN_03793, partial [Planoprotostelium fungivorum]
FNHANDPMKIPQRQFLANNTPTDRDRLINRLRWPSISTGFRLQTKSEGARHEIVANPWIYRICS